MIVRTKYILALLLTLGLLAGCAKEGLISDKDIPESEVAPDDDETSDDDDSAEEQEEEETTPRVREGQMPEIRIIVNSKDFQNLCQRSKDTYIKGNIEFIDSNGWYSDSLALSISFQMKGRGNSSWDNEKKPFRLKLDEKHRVFGMKANRDWALIANYNDKSLLRNTLGYKVSKICGMAWTPKVRACDLYINGDYYGSYLLAQHKEVAGEKVDIDTSTDYYLEVETANFEANYGERIMPIGCPIQFKDPRWPEMDATRQQYIKSYLREWSQAVYDHDFQKAFTLMDTMSFVNYFIIEELAKNIDGNFRKSTFLTKQANKKLVVYHIWDFDIAFGNCNYMHSEFLPDSRGIYGHDPTGWYVKVVDERKKSSGLYQHLFQDPGFVAAVKARWQEVYPELCKLPEWIEEEARINRASYDNNFERWRILGRYIWPNPNPIPSDYDGELAFLKDFLSSRLEWMNSQISQW